MSIAATPAHRSRIEYPDSDGQPMSDNTLQFKWIVTIKEGLEAQFRNDADVFVAGDSVVPGRRQTKDSVPAGCAGRVRTPEGLPWVLQAV